MQAKRGRGRRAATASTGSQPITFPSGVRRPSPLAQELFDLLLQRRMSGATCGTPEGKLIDFPPLPLDTLEFDCRLWKAARLQSRNMASEKLLLPDPLFNGETFEQRAAAQGTRASGERLATTREGVPENLLRLWLASKECVVIMDPALRRIGVESVKTDEWYWTAIFDTEEDGSTDKHCLAGA
mmetsp:Transcript_39456/g.114207  ORF Transcript_39456/g.114207 Transcript_39456/m.114207 type:complete len:184 (+) Transcript_39456:359-910(+)